jgi:outer membrane protein assembly factor BamD
MNRLIYLILIAVLSLASCSEYEKVLKSNDIDLKYKKAFEYYDKKDYEKAVALFEYISAFYKAREEGAKVDFYYAKSLYGQGDYLLAGYKFSEFVKNYRNSEYVEEAAFLYAYCYYLLSPRPSLDQEYTMKAIDAFTLFIAQFPRSQRLKECSDLMSKLISKLYEKSYLNAVLYYNLEDYKASIIALRNALNSLPESEYREEISFLIVKSGYLLAKNSIPSKQKIRYQDVIDDYLTFKEEFPKSLHLKEAERYYELSNKFLENK